MFTPPALITKQKRHRRTPLHSSHIPAIAMPALSCYVWNRGVISCQDTCVGRRWRLGRTWDVIGLEATNARCNPAM